MKSSHDLLVVGGGSAGLVAARFARSVGARVALAESGRLGGDCTWTGCVPSKALLRAARAAAEVRNARRFGVEAAAPRIDMASVRRHVRSAIAHVYRYEDPQALREEGIEVIEGRARLRGDGQVDVAGRRLLPRRIVICTGAGPSVPAIDGLDDVDYTTYETIFENDVLPDRLVIVGGGPVGLEIATAYSALGARVTVVGAEILPGEDADAREITDRALESKGVDIVEASVEGVGREAGRTVVRWKGGEVCGDALLVATGRAPRVHDLGLEDAGVRFDASGVTVDDKLRTNVRHVYAAGDVTGGPQFTHYAGWQGHTAARNALLPGSDDGRSIAVPRVTFLDPEIASIGRPEDEARARLGNDLTVLKRMLDRQDRAVTDGATDGFIKLLLGPKGKIVGATIVAERAGEMINEVALAMHHDLGVGDLAGALHAYPTWSTGLQRMAADHAVKHFASSLLGRVVRKLSGLKDR